MKVRVATMKDLPAILFVAERFVDRESHIGKDSPFDHDVATDTAVSIIRSPSGDVLLGEVGGSLAAIAAMTLQRLHYSKDLFASELLWWVDPEHRRRGIGSSMLKHVERWAKSKGAKALMMAYTTKYMAEENANFYAKNAFEPMQVWVRKEIK